MIVFWLARIRVTLRSSVSAGAPSRIASLRLSGLPASAVPNSLISSVSRSRKGSRSVFRTRSFWTVCETCSPGCRRRVVGVVVLRDRRPGGLAVDEVLGDQRLRLGRALRLVAERAELAGELDRDHGALRGVDVEVGDRAGVDAGDPHVASPRRCRTRCTSRSRRCACRRRPAVAARPATGAEAEGEDQRDPSHGPGCTWLGVAVAGVAVGERAAVGERDRVVAGVDVGHRALVAARAAAGVAGVERRRELGRGRAGRAGSAAPLGPRR